MIQTEHVDGCIIEAGPDSFLSAKPAALDLIRELGLADDVIGSNDHLRKSPSSARTAAWCRCPTA